MPILHFPTLPEPSIGTRHAVMDNSIKSEMVNGCVVTRKRHSRQLHKFQLHWNAMPQTFLDLLLAFYQSVNGGSASFAWADDMSVSRTVRFDSDIDYRPVSNVHWEVSLTLAEV